VYGVEAVKQFLKDNKLTSIIRAHEAQVDGYKMQMVNKSSGIPRVITIFSAPNYVRERTVGGSRTEGSRREFAHR
jgi:serine/threonine-protein phosphatase 2B catalytic subunit